MLPKPGPDVSLGSRLAIAVIVTAYCLGIGLVLVIATIFVLLIMVGYNWGQDVPAPIWVLYFALWIGGPAAGAWLVLKASRNSIREARDGSVFLAPVVAVCVFATAYLVYDVVVQARHGNLLSLLGLPVVAGFFASFIRHEAEVRDGHVAFVGALAGLALLYWAPR